MLLILCACVRLTSYFRAALFLPAMLSNATSSVVFDTTEMLRPP